MKNKYIIDGDITYIILEKRNGEILTAKIDTKDLDKLKDFKYKWFAGYAKNTGTYYAQATVYLGIIDGKPKYTTISMQKYLMDSKDGEEIDHINHDTLDNRRSNLKVITTQKNSLNRKGANKNSKTGIRNVIWSERDKKYIVQLQINGKNTVIGMFDNIEDAAKCAEEGRQKYYKKIYENVN
jgi:hypothetical protein